MSGYKYRDPSRVGHQPLFTETDKRIHALEQNNAALNSELEAARTGLKKANAQVGFYKKRVMKLGQERVQAVKQVTTRVDVNRARVLDLLGMMRAERQELASERSRRQHAEAALSRSEQRTDNVRTELREAENNHRARVSVVNGLMAEKTDLQEIVSDLKTTIQNMTEKPAQGTAVIAENRIRALEGALADQMKLTGERTRERDMARGEAIAAYSVVDQAHTLLTRKQLEVFNAKRLAHKWGIKFEGEVTT